MTKARKKTREKGRTASLALATCSALSAWRRNTRKLWASHNRAGTAWDKIRHEKPRRPWWRKRYNDAADEWGRTLDAIPLPPVAK